MLSCSQSEGGASDVLSAVDLGWVLTPMSSCSAPPPLGLDYLHQTVGCFLGLAQPESPHVGIFLWPTYLPDQALKQASLIWS